ncbi:hypothetical protein [Spirosoma rhododendri]|uniref:6-phosphogluconate dehydrogenase n=1 Tax=Spirosoma rhododendri TaxID=2728024 RepID=A0A7L5DJJ0_9BACT|nr:hypothetical protein [Spirosoma rhododendri]QJD77621.1 hypothetical protein HH216_03715 [Spirosoma rhododendri]
MRGLLYFLLFLFVVLGILYVLTGWSFSDGERAGTVSKFSRRGFVFKTYEGVLNVGGFSGETGSLTPQYFDFSVKDDNVAKQITDAVKTGQRVTLHYEEKILRLPWNGETKYYITNVEAVGPAQGAYGYPGQQQGYPQQQQGYPQQGQYQQQGQQQQQPMQEPTMAPADSVL